jgi:hypothetical protein
MSYDTLQYSKWWRKFRRYILLLSSRQTMKTLCPSERTATTFQVTRCNNSMTARIHEF